MRDQLFLLYELQEIDSKTHACEERLKEIPAKAHELKAELEQVEQQLRELRAHDDDGARDQRKLEGDLAAEREKLKKWESRLNEIRNSREFAALSREIEALKRQNRDVEERLLGLMQEAEQRRAEIEQVSAQVRELQAAYAAEDAKASEAASTVERERSEHERTRGAIATKVKKNLLRQYEYIRAKKAGLALALVRDGSCEGCHMQLPPQLYNELQRGDSIEVCPTCQRILFWDQLAEPDQTEHLSAPA